MRSRSVGPVTFHVGDSTFTLDSTACVARSPYFASLLTGPMTESRAEHVILHPPAPDAFASIAEFMRRGKVLPPRGRLPSVLLNADYFLLEGLRTPLVRRLGEHARAHLKEADARAWAARDPDVYQHLLHVRDARGRTPLHVAAERGCYNSARALMRAGANPLARDSQGATPLHVAAAGDRWIWWMVGVGQAMVLTGRVPNKLALRAQDAQGRTPLHVLVERGRGSHALRILQRLSPAAVHTLAEIPDNGGNTLLHLALAGPHPVLWELVYWLLRHGSHSLAQNHDGQTPAHLFAAHPDRYTLHQVFAAVRVCVGQHMCTQIVRIQNGKGQTPVHVVAQRGGSLGNVSIARSILDMRDNDGNTALHLAVRRARGYTGRWSSLNTLWHNTTRGIANNAGQTPRQLADILKVPLP